jgi:hypothetical protein
MVSSCFCQMQKGTFPRGTLFYTFLYTAKKRAATQGTSPTRISIFNLDGTEKGSH